MRGERTYLRATPLSRSTETVKWSQVSGHYRVLQVVLLPDSNIDAVHSSLYNFGVYHLRVKVEKPGLNAPQSNKTACASSKLKAKNVSKICLPELDSVDRQAWNSSIQETKYHIY